MNDCKVMDGLAPKRAVAYSGGADSTALLLETLQQYPNQTLAFHVHHGLQAAADDFVTHCHAFCAALHVPLHVAYVNAQNALGESPEDAARGARYGALIELARAHGVVASCGAVLLGQHADDQVETFLSALIRGAGLGGLSAMPASFERGGVRFERPLLHRSAAEIRAWLKANGTAFIEDPTNTDRAFTRNKIRLDVLPAVQNAFPQYCTTWARSMRHIAQANDLLTDLACLDLERVGIPPQIQALQQLPRRRQANATRFWLKSQYGAVPSTAQLDEFLKQLQVCQTRGHQINLKMAAGFVSRDGDTLRYNHGL